MFDGRRDRFPRRDRAHRGQQVLGEGVLEQEAAGAGAQRGVDVLVQVEGGQDEHARRGQFLVESLLLGTAGGAIGVLLGTAATYALAYERGWQPLIPPEAAAAGLATAVVVGAVAGLYPAARAARLAPTDALRSA